MAVLGRDHPELAFTALCLSQDTSHPPAVYDLDWITYFMNASNHKAGVSPPTYVSYHFYAVPGDMPTVDPWPTVGTDPMGAWPKHLFTQAADFIKAAEGVNKLIAAGSFGGKEAKINVDEVGIIGGKHCPVTDLFDAKVGEPFAPEPSSCPSCMRHRQ